MSKQQRTTRGNDWTHELLLASLWQLQEAVGFFADEFEPETGIEDALEEDAAGLVYQAKHFACVFESSVLGLEELRREYEQHAPIPAMLRRLAREVEDVDGDPAGDQVTEASVIDHNSCCDDQGGAVVLKICPWSVSAN